MRRSSLTLALVVAVCLTLSMFGFACAYAQTIGVTSPSVPSGITAVAGQLPGQATVSWSASSEISGTIEGYYVYRNGGALANTAGTSFLDTAGGTGLVSGVYGYSVAAYDANGNVSPRSVTFDVLITRESTPPSVPTGVTISGVTTTNSYGTPTTLTISWNASTDSVGVAGYNVYRSGTMITSSTSAFTGTSITDSVTPGSYTYTVDAYNAAGYVSARSALATVAVIADYSSPTTPTSLVVKQTGGGAATLSWASSTESYGVAGYQVFRNGVQIASTTGASYEDSGLSIGTPYTYVVTAYDAAGNISTQSAPVTEIVQPTNGPSTPSIAGDALVGTSSVQLSWSASTDVLAISGYTLYRDGTSVAAVTSTGYRDTGLAPGIHIYNVAATDVSGATSSLSASSTIIIPSVAAATAVTSPAVVSASVAPPAGIAFTRSLYYGMRTAQVAALQSLLAANGYMSPASATGFFGNITLKAVEKFQCDRNIVCNGGAGWGIIGPKTRVVLNTL